MCNFILPFLVHLQGKKGPKKTLILYHYKDIKFYPVIFGTFSTSTNEEIGINSAKKMVGATDRSFA